MMQIEPHEAFEARIRAQHKRKTSFWAHVNGERQVLDNDEPDLRA